MATDPVIELNLWHLHISILLRLQTLGSMQQVATLLAHKRRKADGGHQHSAAADHDGVLELLGLGKDDGGGKGDELEEILERHFGGGEAAAGKFRCTLMKEAS